MYEDIKKILYFYKTMMKHEESYNTVNIEKYDPLITHTYLNMKSKPLPQTEEKKKKFCFLEDSDCSKLNRP